MNFIFRKLIKLRALKLLLIIWGDKVTVLPEAIHCGISELVTRGELVDEHIIIRQTTWGRVNDKYVIFLLQTPNGIPKTILKCVTISHAHLLEVEYTKMQMLHKYSFSSISLPTPLSFIKTDKNSFYFEEFVHGIPLNDLANRTISKEKRIDIYFQGAKIACNTMAELAEKKSRMCDEDFRHFFEMPIAKLVHKGKMARMYPEKVAALIKDLQALREAECFSIPMHGDLWGGSILVSEERTTVIDWEFFREEGVPFWDMFMYLVHPGFALNSHKRGLLDEFCSFCGNVSINNRIRKIIQDFETILNLDLRDHDMEFLFQAFLIFQAVTRDSEDTNDWENCLGVYWNNTPLWKKDSLSWPASMERENPQFQIL